MNKKVDFLVTGASGFLGEVVCRQLVAMGASVVGLYHRHSITIPGVRTIALDLADEGQVGPFLSEFQPGAVIHTAAQTNVGYSQQHPEEARRDIVQATRHLCQNIWRPRDTKVPFVHVSTDQVYDGVERAGSIPYSETDPPNPRSVYGRLKLEAEQVAEQCGDVLELAIVRTALIYGPKGENRGSFLEWLADGIQRGDRMELFVDEIRTPVFVDDLAFALIELAKQRESGLWLAGGGERMSRFEMGLAVAQELKASSVNIIPAKLSETQTPAPRPADLALQSDRLWQTVGRERTSWKEGLKRSLAPRQQRA